MIVTVEDGKIVAKEQRERFNTCACNHGSESAQGDDCHGEHSHSASPESQTKHMSMADAISDCNAIFASGMGYGAYASLKSCNLDAVITDVADIDQAVKMYMEGKLVNYMEKLH